VAVAAAPGAAARAAGRDLSTWRRAASPPRAAVLAGGCRVPRRMGFAMPASRPPRGSIGRRRETP